MNGTTSKDKPAVPQRYWQAHVKALAESGLSRAEYCRQHNLSYHALSYWREKLSRPHNSVTKLVPVSLPIKHALQKNTPELQLIIPGKCFIAIGDNFSPGTLSRLLTLLENR